MNNINAYWRLMRFDKPIGTLLLLWPVLWSLWIASDGHPDGLVLSVFVLGVILMRAAGCVINDIADRNIDGRVERTQHRPLATGEIKTINAIILFVILCLCAFAVVLLMNRLTILLAVVGVLLAILYPFSKRFIHAPQLLLGIAFAWAIPMSFAAQTGHLPTITWYLFFADICWVVAYDTFYAMCDREDDKKLPIKSLALWLGRYDKLTIALLQLVCVLLLLGVGVRIAAHWGYYLALLLTGMLFCYQQYQTRRRQPKACFRAFLNNNYVGFIIFLGIFSHYLH